MAIRKLMTAMALGAGVALTPMAFAAGDGNQESVGKKVGDFASDTAVTAKIKAAFVKEKELSALDISVETTRGVTTLSGKVDSQAQVDLAERVARDVEGVQDVHNNITVEPLKGN
ncbi:MAG: BON domain-containing protein [Pigmentiphaga sp.]|nr:BON domain-containing protein [Pigmentiphaga sp.]